GRLSGHVPDPGAKGRLGGETRVGGQLAVCGGLPRCPSGSCRQRTPASLGNTGGRDAAPRGGAGRKPGLATSPGPRAGTPAREVPRGGRPGRPGGPAPTRGGPATGTARGHALQPSGNRAATAGPAAGEVRPLPLGRRRGSGPVRGRGSGRCAGAAGGFDSQ